MPIDDPSEAIDPATNNVIDHAFDAIRLLPLDKQLEAVQGILCAEGMDGHERMENPSLDLAWNVIDAIRKDKPQIPKTQKRQPRANLRHSPK